MAPALENKVLTSNRSCVCIVCGFVGPILYECLIILCKFFSNLGSFHYG